MIQFFLFCKVCDFCNLNIKKHKKFYFKTASEFCERAGVCVLNEGGIYICEIINITQITQYNAGNTNIGCVRGRIPQYRNVLLNELRFSVLQINWFAIAMIMQRVRGHVQLLFIP